MAFSEGTLVSGYRILRVLGAGGMGTVYLAANPVLPRQDALKVLGGELSSDPAFRTRFQREADLAATLDHPNIVTVYTRGESDDGHLWIAMQYVAGSDALKELQENRMTVTRAVAIIGDVAKALDYAHRRNLVHRDVKPANFLLDPDGERALLADFGIARALDDSENLTMTGTVMATVAYAAPESLSGGRIDGRADIYALACSLFMLLAGKTPYASAGGMHAVMAAHLYQPIPRLTDHVPHLPPAIDAVFARGMAKNPDERFQTAREFTDAVAAVLQGGAAAMGSGPGPGSGTVPPPVAPTAPWNTPPPPPGPPPAPGPAPPAPRPRGGGGGPPPGGGGGGGGGPPRRGAGRAGGGG
ncbi:serine/threonine-protein kinase, partial [Mycobacterium sp. ACS4331]|uniref:serine/threonine-protein kinase n=1 Tax=Mycobacterium sp. ACS4331 TaxID=1834121 RepID=UPI0012FA9534